MAVGIAQSELEKFKFPRSALNHLLIKIYPIRLFLRKLLLSIESKKNLNNRDFNISLTQNFERGAKKFQKDGWAFVEEIFPKEVHKLIVEEWPKFYHFHPVRNILKSYDSHFISQDKTLGNHPVINDIKKYLNSSEFSGRLDNFAGDSVSGRIAGKLVFSRARYKSACVNHLDSVSESKVNEGASINIIFFVKGTGGRNSGGTCIYRDKNGEIIYEPTITTNSCIIYRSDIHYHGFPPMKFGKFRWMISCHSQVRNEIL